MSTNKLTKDEWLLLEWLSKEDVSRVGECDGPAFQSLVDQGLAEVARWPSTQPREYRGCWLTVAGWEVITDARAAASDTSEIAEASWS